jgi:hypothetical protein
VEAVRQKAIVVAVKAANGLFTHFFNFTTTFNTVGSDS